MDLSIIIPAYNERARIRPMLDAYLAVFLARYGERVEFLVVVNGTTDGTEAIVQEYIDQYPQMKMVVILDAVGKGGAIRRGLAESSGEWVGFVDADGSTPPEAFLDLVEHARPNTMTIASRWLPESIVPHRQPWQRRLLSRGFNFLVRVFFGIRLQDTQCGAKVMPGELARTVHGKLGATNWVIDVDLLLQARRSGARIVEHPTTWNDKPGSKLLIRPKTVWRTFLALLRLRLFYSPLQGMVRVADRMVGRHLYEAMIRHGRLIQHGETPVG